MLYLRYRSGQSERLVSGSRDQPMETFAPLPGQSVKASTWVYRIGLNTCISFFRKSKSRPEVVPISVDLEAVAEEEDKTAQLHELYRMINCLGRLERALILLWLEERSYQEMADITGISRNNVAVKLNRIKEKLKQMSNE